ncbi:hypothetical protein MBLNU230_g6278t1 [Neophaeotheca triangularis]
MEPNHIFQYSLLNALMDGVSGSGIPASELIKKGNQGLGTFVNMNGELLMLDNTIYQLQPHGHIRIAEPTDQIPFAVVTQFVPEKTVSVKLERKEDIDAVLEDFTQGQARNLFVTYRIEGAFEWLKCRTVHGAEYPGQPLSELGKNQVVDEFGGLRGTIVGFRTPANWQGFGVAGEHLHFVDDGRSRGGHVLGVRGDGEVRVQMAVVADVHVSLPRTGEFNRARLVTDDEGVKEVEG